MNKNQIETIAEKYVTFEVETNNFRSGALNMDKISFPVEGLMLISSDRDTYIQLKDIKIIRGVRL